MIAQELSKSTATNIANAHLLVDAGKGSTSLPNYVGNRIPAWMLPNLPSSIRDKFRPDILIIDYDATLLDRNQPHWTRELRSLATLRILEIGFGSDTRFEQTLERKETQHAKLSQELRAHGWTVRPTIPLIFGMGGCHYTHTRDALRDDLSLPTAVIDTILRRIQKRTAARAHQIVISRRKLERQSPSAPINRIPRCRHRRKG
jgi:hypothetical protein